MFPKISDVINYLFGTHLNIPIQSYGFMMVVAFIIGAFVLVSELKRREMAGEISARRKTVLKGAPAGMDELIFSGLFGFILGWKVIGLFLMWDLFSKQPQEFIFSSSGSFIAGLLLAAVAVFLTWYDKKRKELKPPLKEEVTVHPYQLTLSIVLIAAASGIIGSKIFDIFERIDDFNRDPAGVLFSFSGLTFYGGLILATFTVAWYTGRNGITFPTMADTIAPTLILAYAIGRIGCQLAGDGCWGMVNLHPQPVWLSWLPGWTWSYSFPHNVINEGIPIPSCTGDHCFVLMHPVWPTSFYETLMGLLIFIILWSIRKSLSVPGYLFSVYLILNGAERFLIEQIRVNVKYNVFGWHLTQAEIIAIVIILLGISGFWIFRKLNRKKINRHP